MDTPERNQIASSTMSKFEDSPVFNYINSLSPIKPVKSRHVTQTFSSLTFSSVPSIFTSPHVNSLKESRFLIRHQDEIPSTVENSSGTRTKADVNSGNAVNATQPDDIELHNNFDTGVIVDEPSIEPLVEQSEFSLELPRTMKYECGSPDREPGPSSGPSSESVSEPDMLSPVVTFVTKAPDLHQDVNNVDRVDQKIKEPARYEWEKSISDVSDILIFSSPNDAVAFRGLVQRSPDFQPGYSPLFMSRLFQNDVTNLDKPELAYQITSDEKLEDPSSQSQPMETSQLNEMTQMQDNLNNSDLDKCMDIYSTENVENGPASSIPFASQLVTNIQRGLRRRCLDFEMDGSHRKSITSGSSSTSSQREVNAPTNPKHLFTVKSGGDSFRRILPGIGLHLNSLAASRKDYKFIKQETLSLETQAMVLPPISTASLNPPLLHQESLLKSSVSIGCEQGTEVMEDGPQEPAYLNAEELDQSSKKSFTCHCLTCRHKVEHAGETESCKRCNCKKSKCLKLYCECFAAGVYCIEPCACQDCFNKPIHEDMVLATRKQIETRNPLAFAPKVIRAPDPVAETGEDSSKTPASARHKRGCNCKKSSCLKKYCECFQGGVGCSINCRCEGCKNPFGRKDGMECETVEEENETNEERWTSMKTEDQNSDDQNLTSALVTTPGIGRPTHMVLPSKIQPPRSSFLTTIGPSYMLHSSQKFGKPEYLRPQPVSEKPIQTNFEDDIPEILRGNGTPTTSVKTSSPNSKRVSPPQGNFGSSPGLRSGRRLILQSIPSFPSLTPQH